MNTCIICKECEPRKPKEMSKKTQKRHLCKKRSLLRTGQEQACMFFMSKLKGNS